MPVINLNQNNQQAQAQSNSSQVNSQVSHINKDMKLQSDMDVNQSNNGVREYNLQNQVENTQQLMQANPDISNQLESKLTNLNQTEQQIKPQPLNQVNQLPGENKPKESISNIIENKVHNAPTGNKYSLDELLMQSISLKASDLHLSVGHKAKVRIDGDLKNLNTQVFGEEDLLEFVKQALKTRKEVNIDELKQMDLSYVTNNRRFRVNIFKQKGNLSMVSRVIPNIIKSLEELRLPPILKEFTKIASGLVLFTGPTGSGKSTTLASMLNFVNQAQSKHIITLEDPIEFVFPKGNALVDQRELGIDFETWQNALRSLMRQDPDIVLVGEMRDYKTIASTVTVSETGHLVFATLHTNSASQTIDRIIDVFPENQQAQIRTQLANVLSAVVSQRLVPLAGGGRIPVNEIMISTPAVRNAIREGKTHQIDNMIQTGQDYGMITMEKSLVNLVKNGVISADVARSTSNKPEEIDTLLTNR